jgi:single-strand DNA-binding protein
MSSTLNVIHLIGRVGRTPVMRYLDTGRAVTHVRLATDRPTGPDREPQTDWHDVVCWGDTAEFANEYLDVGRLVYVSGRLAYHEKEIDGQRRRFPEIDAREVVPLDRRPARPDADAADDEDEEDDGQDAPTDITRGAARTRRRATRPAMRDAA